MKKNAIFHGLTALCSGLVYAFFALPFVTVTTEVASKSSSETTSGYKFLEQVLKATESGTNNAKFATYMALIMLIVAGIVFLCSVVALLCDFEVIKNDLVAKIANWAVFATSVLLVIFAVLTMISNAIYVSKDIQANFDAMNKVSETLGGAGAKMTASAGWLMTIISTLLGIGSAVTSAWPIFVKKSK